MADGKKFLTTFFLAFLGFIFIVTGFVTWVDPYRNLNYPWTIDFVSDRNIAFKRLTLMRENKNYTDLVVGSSTSEVVQTDILRDIYGKNAFIASNGGASAALRYLVVKDALQSNPNLKKIIYIADLFELKDLFLYNEVYFQPEFQKLLDPETIELIEHPSLISRLNDYLSRKIIDRAMRTLTDYKKFKKGIYTSEFTADGTTANSLVLIKPTESFESRVHRTATEHDYLYKDMEALHEPSKKMLKQLVNFMKKYPDVSLDIVIAPVHPDYFKHFEDKFITKGLYTQWVEFMNSLAENNIRVLDYSYPTYLQKGLSADEIYWKDGVHFSSETTKVILKEIYKN